jgi:hypothetical protein
LTQSLRLVETVTSGEVLTMCSANATSDAGALGREVGLPERLVKRHPSGDLLPRRGHRPQARPTG